MAGSDQTNFGYTGVQGSVQALEQGNEILSNYYQDINNAMIEKVNMNSRGAILGKLGSKLFDGYEKILYPHVANDPKTLRETNAKIVTVDNNYVEAEADTAALYGEEIQTDSSEIAVDEAFENLLHSDLSLEQQRAIEALKHGTVNIAGNDIILRGKAGSTVDLEIGGFTFNISFGEDGRVKLVRWNNENGASGVSAGEYVRKTLEQQVQSHINASTSESDLMRRFSLMTPEEQAYAQTLPAFSVLLTGAEFAISTAFGEESGNQIIIPAYTPKDSAAFAEAGADIARQSNDIQQNITADRDRLTDLANNFYRDIYNDPSFQSLEDDVKNYYVDLLTQGCSDYNNAVSEFSAANSHPWYAPDGAIGDFDSAWKHLDADHYDAAVEAANNLNEISQGLPDADAILAEFEIFNIDNR